MSFVKAGTPRIGRIAVHRIVLLCVVSCVALAAAPFDARSQHSLRVLGPPTPGAARPTSQAAVACVQEVEPNDLWTIATQGPGLVTPPGIGTFCVWGELSSTQDKDVYSTWLGFPFSFVSEWGGPLNLRGSDLLMLTVYQRVPHGWLRIAQKAGLGEIHLSADEMFFEHFPMVTPPYLYMKVEGRPQTYRLDNFDHTP